MTLFAQSNLWMARHTVRVIPRAEHARKRSGVVPEAPPRPPGRSADRSKNPLRARGTTRDGSPARFRRPLVIDLDETDRNDFHGTRDPALSSASLRIRPTLKLHRSAKGSHVLSDRTKAAHPTIARSFGRLTLLSRDLLSIFLDTHCLTKEKHRHQRSN